MPQDGTIADLYERDFYTWGLRQAAALRSAQAALRDDGVNDPSACLSVLDWENIAEEIEALSRKDRRELRERLATVIKHLIKLRDSPATDPRAGWRDTVLRARQAIEVLLDDSPSLRQMVPDLLGEATIMARRLAGGSLHAHGEAAAIQADFTPKQILTDWWPDAVA